MTRLLGVAALVVGCIVTAPQEKDQEPKPDPKPPRKLQEGARADIHDQMVADKHGRYGPADGGGSARVVEAPEPVAVAGSRARYLLEYTAGEHGIAVGGSLFFQVSPFWFWDTPQSEEPESAGFTRVTTSAPGVGLEVATIAPQCMQVKVGGAPLAKDATIAIDFGCGPGAARVDGYAEAEESFYFWVDGDGDGTRKLIAKDPHVAIRSGPPADLAVSATSEAGVGGELAVTIALLDAVGNAAVDFTGTLELEGEGLELPAKVEFAAADRGRKRVQGRALESGVRYAIARGLGMRYGRASNPILVSEKPRKVLWADLHGHSSLSDGTGTPEDYYDYARDVAGLDVAVLTDHDHWGLRKLDQEPLLWKRIRDVTARANEPGRFTTLLGYEWTSWLYGHRHVLYFDGEGEVLSSVDEATDSPQGLWKALRERNAKAITIPHHPGGGPVPIDWSIAPDPEFEPVLEIVSVHGSSEEPAGPRLIHAPVKGHFARDALARGYRLGFVGSGDTHDGHPGLGHIAQPSGGVAAILVSTQNTREEVLAALKARTCYATSGPRILLWFSLDGARLGSIVPMPAKPAEHSHTYRGLVIGTMPIARLDLVKNGAVVHTVPSDGTVERALEWRDPDRKPGDAVYLRAIQSDSHAAWSSPIFTE